MTIRNILCVYSGETAKGKGLFRGAALAQHYGAWITGVLRHELSGLERRVGGRIPQGILDEIHGEDDGRIKEISDRFLGHMREKGLAERADFVALEHGRDPHIPEFARTFDLVVTGVHSSDPNEAHFSAYPEDIALRSGRPVLIVPNEFEAAAALADHAVLAWDGSRAAARALGDALPVLENKARVSVLSVGSTPPGDIGRLKEHLARHGIQAEFHQRPRTGSVAHTILDLVREVGAQLLVLGAFEHSRMSHDFWGGPTTDLIRESRVPLFMAH